MATTSVTETSFLQTSGPFTLRITVGFAQAGGSYVVLIAGGTRTEILPINGVYHLTPVANSILSCTTTVQDINLSTNKTSVIHDFTNAAPGHLSYDKSVEHNNDRVVYDIQYIL